MGGGVWLSGRVLVPQAQGPGFVPQHRGSESLYTGKQKGQQQLHATLEWSSTNVMVLPGVIC